MTKRKNLKKRSVILISAITSFVIAALIICGAGYFVYIKYLKKNGLQRLVNSYLREYVDSGNLKDVIVEKIEQYTGGTVSIEKLSMTRENGLTIEYFTFLKDDIDVVVKDANLTIPGKIVLNKIVKRGKTSADKILIESAQIDLNSITLNNVSINPTAEITIENPRLNVEKVIVAYSAVDLLKGKLLITDVTAISPELYIVRRENGIWMIMDALKELTDNIDLSNYSGLLKDGIVLKEGILHFIDKEFFSGGELYVKGIGMTIKPFLGSLKDLEINGFVQDPFYGSYNVAGHFDLNMPSLNLKINAKELSVSESFFKGVPIVGEKIWNTYKPMGKLDMNCLINLNNTGGKRRVERHVRIDFMDMEATYIKWPFTASRIAGRMTLDNNRISIKNVSGYVYQDGQQGTNVNLNVIMEIDKPVKKILVKANDVILTKELVDKLPNSCKKLYKKFKPGGRADLDVVYSVNDDGKISKDYKVEVICKDWNLIYPEMPVPLNDVNGKIVVSNRVEKSRLGGGGGGSVQLKDFKGYFDDGQQVVPINFSGEFGMNNPMKLININVPDVNLSDKFLSNLPDKYGKNLENFRLAGKIGLDVVFDQRDLGIKPETSITVNCKGSTFTDKKSLVSLNGVNGIIKAIGNNISADNIAGKCFDGKVNGAISVDVENSFYKYDGAFSFKDVDMEKLFRNLFKTDQEWPGLLSGKVKFNRDAKDQSKLLASGHVNLYEGSISDVPVALSVINILNFGLPTKVVFHSGRINFVIKDDIIEITEAKVYSDTVELVARGTVGFNGDLDVRVVVEFTKNTLKDIPIVGPLFDFVVGGVRKSLTKVHVGGTIAEPTSSLSMFEPIKKPIKNVIELIPTVGNGSGTSTTNVSEEK